MTDSTGTVVASYYYDPFGVITEETGEVINPFRYVGEYYDEETGMVYLRARYYDPSIGRFISEDPIRDGYNWYVYCGNNPVMFVDPWGLAGSTRFVIGDSVRFRDNPGLDSSTYELLSKNAEVDYTGNKTDIIDGHKWAEVKYNGTQGWVAADYLGTEPAGGFIGPKQFIGPMKTGELTGDSLLDTFSVSGQFGTGLYAQAKVFGVGVEVGGKRYYEFSPGVEPTENMQFSLMAQITKNIQAGFNFTGTIDATTKTHLQNTGFAGVKIGKFVLGWGDLPHSDDASVLLEAEAYFVVGGGGNMNVNLSELWKKMFN